MALIFLSVNFELCIITISLYNNMTGNGYQDPIGTPEGDLVEELQNVLC